MWNGGIHSSVSYALSRQLSTTCYVFCLKRRMELSNVTYHRDNIEDMEICMARNIGVFLAIMTNENDRITSYSYKNIRRIEEYVPGNLLDKYCALKLKLIFILFSTYLILT